MIIGLVIQRKLGSRRSAGFIYQLPVGLACPAFRVWLSCPDTYPAHLLGGMLLPFPAIFRRLGKALKTELERSDVEYASFWKPYSELPVWVVFLGAYVSPPPSTSAVAVAKTNDEQGIRRER